MARRWRSFRSQTIGQSILTVLTFISEVIAIIVAMGVGSAINNPNFVRADNKLFYLAQRLASRFWWLLLIAVVLLIIQASVGYLKSAQERKNKENYGRLLPYLISGALEDIYRTPPSPKPKIEAILQRIEAVTRAVLENSANGAVISANIMRYLPASGENKVDGLDLTRSGWGSRPSDREDICLPISEGIPGAPEAFRTRKTVYIPDTQGRKVREHFKGKRYRSIVSVPVSRLDSDRTCCGILNIDSTAVNQFHGSDFIEEELLPQLDPLVKFLAVMWDDADA